MDIRPQDLKLARKAKGWAVEVPARLYGEYTRGKPFDVHTIYRLEEDFMPQDEKRRWILARMYNLAPALLGLSMTRPARTAPTSYKVRPVDLQEFQSTLISYWKDGYAGTTKEALIDLAIRINSLHDVYHYSSEKEQLKRLLCGYHMRRGEVAKEVGFEKAALEHYSRAVMVATENDYDDLSAATLYRRGEFYFHRWELKKALADFNQAKQFQAAPPDVLGRVLSGKGMALARMARSEKEMSAALGVVNESKSLIRSNEQEPSCLLDFPQSQFKSRYIITLLSSPTSKLHQPDEADNLITDIYRETVIPNLHAHEQINELLLSALIAMDQGHHPIATAHLQDALELIRAGRLFYLPAVEHAYKALLESPYGKSVEVAELGLELLVVQMPHLFKTRLL